MLINRFTVHLIVFSAEFATLHTVITASTPNGTLVVSSKSTLCQNELLIANRMQRKLYFLKFSQLNSFGLREDKLYL